MRHFNVNANGVDNKNAFLLAKMTEMMYPERLDYQLRYMKNNQRAVSSIPSSTWIKDNKIVSNNNFECAFAARFAHYFYDESTMPVRPGNFTLSSSQLSNATTTGTITNTAKTISGTTTTSSTSTVTTMEQYKRDSAAWVNANTAVFKFISRRATVTVFGTDFGFDPELMVVSTPTAIFIVYRGTDNIRNLKAKDFDPGEWLGTNFNFLQTDGVGGLAGTKVHQGFYASYIIVKNELINFLNSQNARSKKIWIAGHSLGSAMAIITGADLQASGFNVQGVYGFASPRVLGDNRFKAKADLLLPNKIHRFEYYIDPIPLIWVPGFEAPGKRQWYDHVTHDRFKRYANVGERYASANPCEFNKCPGDNRTDNTVRSLKARMSGLITDFGLAPAKMEVFQHNPQFYVRAMHHQLSSTEKSILPAIDDSLPYLYDDAPNPLLPQAQQGLMPGTK